jgi:hypothetical protein
MNIIWLHNAYGIKQTTVHRKLKIDKHLKRDELRLYTRFLLICSIEDSLAIAGLLSIIWQKVYDTLSLDHICWDERPLHKLTWDPACHELFLMHMHSETDGIFVFNIFSLCHSILYTMQPIIAIYYLTFQETIKIQLKGKYGGMMINATSNNSQVISW